jgi:hypothetical protein
MTKSMLLCGAAFMAMPILAPAKDFPLEFKTVNAQQVMSFPGGYGAYGSLQASRPSDVTKVPAAVSKHPIYGQFSSQGNRMCFRLDESQGDGKGYDRLIVDVNQNGDLTDDPVVSRVEEAGSSARTVRPENALFGPIQAPETKMIGSWRPVYYAQAYIYNRPASVPSGPQNFYYGQMRFKAGWYLETTVELDGTTRKIGIVDGDCNFRLGDANLPTTYRNGTETNWYFQGGDFFLEDNDGSGKFESAVTEGESAPFGPVLYLGAKPYKAALSADAKSLALEPWTGPLAELTVQPHGDQVSRLQLAWESAPGQWQLLQPGVENGKAAVPPGNYRLYTCTLAVKTSAGDSLVLSGYRRLPKDTVKAEADATTPFQCGAPLEIKVTSERRGSTTGSSSFLGRIVGSMQPLEQLIQASVVGAGGETYSSFVLANSRGQQQPPKPVYTISTTDGKQVESGNMEFG